jgi:cytochrome d ubiquinol oxidase subunit I
VLTSLTTLTVLYGALAIVEAWLLVRFVRGGITTGDTAPVPAHTPGETPDDDADDATGGGRRADDDVLSFAY